LIRERNKIRDDLNTLLAESVDELGFLGEVKPITQARIDIAKSALDRVEQQINEALSAAAPEPVTVPVVIGGQHGETAEEALRRQLAEFGFTAQRMFEELPSPKIKLDLLEDEMLQDFEAFGLSLGRTVHDTVTDAFLGIETDFDEMLKRMVYAAATSQLFTALGAVGGPVGTVFSFLGFGGQRAAGGDVQPGKFYRVGERGEELFAPRVPGMIIPNDRMGGSGGLHVNVDARGATDPAEVERAVNRAVLTAVQLSGANTVSMLRHAQRPSIA
jgi:hypothetical protein